MKKLILYSLLACATFSMQSCLFSEEDLFEQSSADRENASVLELKSLLTSSTNGWRLVYRYGNGGMSGAANLFFKFDANEVTIASDYATSSYTPGQTATSLYTVQSYNGTEISFDSYNEILHAFCEPNGYNDPGLMGDYEFIVRSTSENEIRLTGKKHGVEMVMTRLDDTVDWTTYLATAAQISDDSDYPQFAVINGGQKIAVVERSLNERAFTVVEDNGDGTSTSYVYPFVATDKGVELIEPLVVSGIPIQNLTWNGEERTFTCTDEGVDAVLKYERSAGYDQYLGTYLIEGASNLSAAYGTITLEPYKDGRLYMANYGFSFSSGVSVRFQMIFNYDIETEGIYIYGMNNVGVDSNGGIVELALGFTSGGGRYSIFNSRDFIMEGIKSQDAQGRMVIFFALPQDFKENGAQSLLFLSSSIWDVWTDPVMTKLD